MTGNNSVQIMLGDQEEDIVPHKSSGDNKDGVRKYGRPSADYHEVSANGLRRPANDNDGNSSAKAKIILKIALPILLGLAFLAWF